MSDNEKSGITYGRRQIFTDYTEVTEDNIIQILSESFIEHSMNVSEISFLKRYEKGDQPILNRVKTVRPEINNKIVENNAHVATKFIVNYSYGQPITYVQRSKKDTDEFTTKVSNGNSDEIAVGLLNEMMLEQGKASKDLKLGNDSVIGGQGYRLVLANRNYGEEISPFEIMTLNPLTTYVVYTNDAYREPVLGVSYTELKNGDVRFGAYSKTQKFEVLRTTEKQMENGTEKEKIIFGEIKVTVNGIGEIPIIEYINDFERMGAFERAIPVMDALNLATSDRLNDIAQHVQSLLWLHNAELQEDDKDNLKEGGIILTKSNDNMQANIKYLESILDQSATQSLVDYLYDQYLQLTCIPGREQSTGGNTGTAIMLSNGWQLTEIAANARELIFDESEKRFLKVVLKICKSFQDVPKEVKTLRISDIEIHHGRNKDYELINKATALATLVNTGVDGNTAFSTVNLFPDSQQAWNDSKEIVEGIQKKLVAEIQKQPASAEEKEGTVFDEDDKDTKINENLEIGYQDKTAEAIVTGIMMSLKPLQDKIDAAIAG